MRIRMLMAASAAIAVSLTPSAANAADTPAAPLHGGDGNGRYIVVMKDGASSATVDRVADRAGAAVEHRYSAAITGFSAKLTRGALATVRRDPTVAYVEHDRELRIDTPTSGSEVSANGSQSPAPWHLDRIDQRYLPLNNRYWWLTQGTGVRVYVIDTGVRATHPEFGGRVSGGWDFIDNDANPDDCNGHGTGVAGVVGSATYGVAKTVRLVPVRVLNCSGSGTYAGLIAGVDWVTANAVHPAAAVMGLSGSSSLSLNSAVQNSINSGVSYSVAAGDSAALACNYSPGQVRDAITVSATNSADTRPNSANYGDCLDLFAPGVNVTTLSATGTTIMGGTAISAGLTAGVAALYLEIYPTATATQVRNAIVLNATPGVVINPGPGSPNLLLYSLLT